MAPALWERQLAAGRLGHHAGHAVRRCGWPCAFGLRRVMLANALVDPVGLAAVSRALDADPELRVAVAGPTRPTTVAAMDAGLAALRARRAR